MEPSLARGPARSLPLALPIAAIGLSFGLLAGPLLGAIPIDRDVGGRLVGYCAVRRPHHPDLGRRDCAGGRHRAAG